MSYKSNSSDVFGTNSITFMAFISFCSKNVKTAERFHMLQNPLDSEQPVKSTLQPILYLDEYIKMRGPLTANESFCFPFLCKNYKIL